MLKNNKPDLGQNVSDLKPINNTFLDNSIDKLAFEINNFLKEHNAKTILLSGCSAACGTTTIVRLLATKLAKLEYRTILLDINMRKNYDSKKKSTLAQYLSSDVIDINSIIYNDYHSNNLQYINAGFLQKDFVICNNNPIENLQFINGGFLQKDFMKSLSSEKMKDLFNYLNENYDIILIDAPPITVVSDAEIIFKYVDGISLVAALNETKKSQLTAGKNSMDAYRDKYLGLIINKIDAIEYKKISPQYNYFANLFQKTKHANDQKENNKEAKSNDKREKKTNTINDDIIAKEKGM